MTLVDRMELYKTNDRIREYVDKFMKKHALIDVESALECITVKDYIDYVIKEDREHGKK